MNVTPVLNERYVAPVDLKDSKKDRTPEKGKKLKGEKSRVKRDDLATFELVIPLPDLGSTATRSQPEVNPITSALRGLSADQMRVAITQLGRVVDGARVEIMEEKLEADIAETKPSPAAAAAKAGSQELLDRLDEDPHARLLSGGEMASYTGKSRNWPAETARKHRLIALRHAGKTYYPAFQIDPELREPWPWVSPLVEILEDQDTSGRHFALWAATPSPWFEGEAPVGHVGDPDFLRKAASDLTRL